MLRIPSRLPRPLVGYLLLAALALLLAGLPGNAAARSVPPDPAALIARPDVASTADTDGDGVHDDDEAVCGGDPGDPSIRPERLDEPFAGVDDDADGLVDEPLPSGSGQADCDGDGYIGAAEAHVFSATQARDQDSCGASAWPSEIASDDSPGVSRITIADLTSFLAPVRHLQASPGEAGFDVRWDLAPGSGIFPDVINLSDMTVMIAGPTGYPPMLGGEKALGGPACPWVDSSIPPDYELIDGAVYEKTQYDQRPLHVLADGSRYVVIPLDWEPGGLRVLMQAGSSEGWAEADAAHRPASEGQITGVSSVLDSRGVIHIAWLRKSPGSPAVRYITFDTNADLWGGAEDVTTVGLADSFLAKASISIDPDDHAHIAYGGADGRIYYTENTAGEWSFPLAIDDSHGGSNPAVHVSPDGVVHIVWGTSSIYYREETAAGWQPVETIATDAAATNTGYPMFTANESGEALAGYWDNPGGIGADWNLKVRKRSVDGSWTDAVTIMANTWGGSVEWGGDVTFINGNWVTSWVHDYGKLFYAVSADGANWTPPVQILSDQNDWAWARLVFGANESPGGYLEIAVQRSGVSDSPFELGWYRQDP